MTTIGANLTQSITTLDEGQGAALGDVYCDTEGRKFVFVQADGVAALGDVMLIDEAYQAERITTGNSNNAIGDRVGVAVYAFADNDYGWLQTCGVVDAISVANSAAANTKLNTTGTAGRVDDNAAAGAETILGLYTTAAESSNLAPGILHDPYVDVTL